MTWRLVVSELQSCKVKGRAKRASKAKDDENEGPPEKKTKTKEPVDNIAIWNEACHVHVHASAFYKSLFCQVRPQLIAAGIPLPSGDYPAAQRASFTVPAEYKKTSIGVLWRVGQLYVAKANAFEGGPVLNKRQGATITVQKQGGWKPAWLIASKLAIQP